MSSVEQSEVWFLTGSQELYGDAVLRDVLEQSRSIAATLDAVPEMPVRIVHRPVLTGASAIREACAAAAASPRCIGVIAWMHTFSPAKAWMAGLDLLDKPLLHFHTQANLSLPWSEIDMDFMNLNQAAHGDREFAFIQTRMRVRRKTVVGHCTDTRVHARVAAWARAAVGWHAAHEMRVARFGDNMRDVADTEGDKLEAQLRLGVSVNTYSVNDLVAGVERAEDKAIDDLVQEYEDLYAVSPELRVAGGRHESLRYAARVELALRQFLTTGGFGAFTTNFEDLGGLRQLPGLAVQRLMADGYGFGGEGDWKTALLVRLLKAMETPNIGGTSFMEDYTYHFGPGEPKVLGAHMLEVCPSIADKMPACEIHPLGIGNREDPVRLVFSAAPATGFVVGLIDMGERLRLVMNDVEVVEPDEPLRNLPVAHAVWKPAPDFQTALEAWLIAGGPHHTALTTAVNGETLSDFVTMAGLELLHIDATTAIEQFSKEIRWNGAYHRLAQAL